MEESVVTLAFAVMGWAFSGIALIASFVALYRIKGLKKD